MVVQASERLARHTRINTHADTHVQYTHRVRRPASSARSTTHTGGGAGLGVGVARLGVDVALITVQVEIVRVIDCASKCYTSHLSISFFFFFLYTRLTCHSQRGNCEYKLIQRSHQLCNSRHPNI